MHIGTSPILTLIPSLCSWVKKFGEHNGLDLLLKILKSCCAGSIHGKDAILRRIQYQCVRSLKAFMNNKVSGVGKSGGLGSLGG